MESYSELHNISTKVFEAVAGTTSVFLLPLFLGRVVFANILGDGAKVFTILKGTVVYFVLIAAFPLIVEVLFSIPEAYLPKTESMGSFMAGSESIGPSGIPFALDKILEVVLALFYWVVYYLHVFFMLLMCSMAPVVFLLSAVLGVGLGINIFMGLLIVGSSWPIIWYGFDQIHASLVSTQGDAFGAKCLELLITLFKGLGPITFASLAVKSPVGQSLGQAVSGAISVGRWTSGSALGAGARVMSFSRIGRATSSTSIGVNRNSYQRSYTSYQERGSVPRDSLARARNQKNRKRISKK